MKWMWLFVFYLPIVAVAQKLPLCKHATVVIAHRGDHTRAPENTLEAIEAAIEDNADYVEMDLRTTADGVLVLQHDSRVDRMTNLSGEVSSLPWANLRQAEVWNKEHPEWGKSRVPTFEEVLARCHNRIHIYLDFKDADVGKTWQQITQAKMEHQVVVYINRPDQFLSWRKIAPQVPLMVSLPDSIRTVERLEEFLKIYDAEILDGDAADYTPEMVAFIHREKRVIWVDVQGPSEGESTWQHALSLGLQGLQTDQPKALISFLKAHHRR